ncbi:MAG: hypothetical protein AAB971_01155 [Patescibacteria group bacterium]
MTETNNEPAPLGTDVAAENAALTAEPVPTPESNSAAPVSEITWQASEFVHHDKSPSWYIALMIGSGLVAALIFWLTRDIVSVAVVIVGAALLATYGSRKPRQLDYKLDAQGVQIGQKYRVYNEFRSFSVAPEGAFSSIVFMPLKRFASITTIYFAPEDEEKIVNILSGQLPFEPYQPDAVDKLMKSIRF